MGVVWKLKGIRNKKISFFIQHLWSSIIDKLKPPDISLALGYLSSTELAPKQI